MQISKAAITILEKILSDSNSIYSDRIDLYKYCGTFSSNNEVLNEIYYFLIDEGFAESNNPYSERDKYLVQFTSKGRMLHKAGNIEKFYSDQIIEGTLSQQSNSAVVNIIGNGNITNLGNSANLTGINISLTENYYDTLKKLGVEEKDIAELKDIISNSESKNDSFKTKVYQWLTSVSASVVSKGISEHLPAIHDAIHNLIQIVSS